MKELQKAIEETLKPIFSYEIDICKKCGHNKESHYWNGGGFVGASGYDSCLVEGCGCTCLSEETETEVSVAQTPLKHYVEELTQLITSREQEIREEAIWGFAMWLDSNSISINREVNRLSLEQYLAQQKENK